MQKEKPVPTIAELEATLGGTVRYASGGQIESFREGWAHNVMGNGDTAHYYRRNSFDNAVALCGKWVEARWVYGPGNYPRCKTCQRAYDQRKRHNAGGKATETA